MDDPAVTLIVIGGFLLLGLLTDFLGRRTPLPRVTLLLLLGVLIGPTGLDLLPDGTTAWFPLVTDLALVMVGFLLGSTLTPANLRRHGGAVLWISILDVVGTVVVVGVGLLLLGVPVEIACVLAAAAAATDPAATIDVLDEAGARGTFAQTVRGIVAADDAWGLIAFTLIFCGLGLVGGGGAGRALAEGARELGGAALLGLLFGLPMAYLTGRIRPGEPTLLEALGFVLVCGGIALWLDLSFLLAAMVLGAVVANVARHHTRPFHAIRGVEWPFLVMFFLLAGATLDPRALVAAGAVGAAYVALRVGGRQVGTRVGAVIAGAGRPVRNWIGLALLPQAGVALGMVLVAAERFPQHADLLLSVAIGATVAFELIGPVATRFALRHVPEADEHDT